MVSVLFVDDEINILSSLKRGLIDEEYQCFFASSGKEALEILENNEIGVIVTDMRMPEMDGLALLKQVKEKYPKTVRIVLSGYTQLQQILTTINQVDIFKFITKPWKLETEFKVIIQQAIEYYRLQVEREELKKSLESKNQAYQNILKNIDEVIASAKNDVQITRGLGIHTVNYIDSLLDIDKPMNEIRLDISYIRKIFNGIISAAASEYKNILVKDLIESFTADLKNKNNITKIDIVDDHKAAKVRIKPELIYLIFKAIEELFINDQGKYYIKFICEHKSTIPVSSQAEITMLISCLSDCNTTVLKDWAFHRTSEKIELINRYLGEAVKPYMCSISAARVDINIGIKLQL